MAVTHKVLTDLPAEILLDIYQHLDLDSILCLALANSSFLEFFEKRKALIILPVLARDFSPFDELLQVFTASPAELVAETYHPKRIIFKRYPGDTGQVLAQPEEDAPRGFTTVGKRKPHTSPETVILTGRDLGPILQHCRLVQQWEDIFPHMRWFHAPADCRSLREHERHRFRRAFYRWWLYGTYFHGDAARPRIAFPEPFVQDIRVSQLRHHSTSELLELMDLVETVNDLILHYICPRLDPANSWNSLPLVESQGRAHALSTSWADQSRWARITKTYAKLGPKQLLYFFNNIYSFPRNRLITETQIHVPNLTFDQASIQVAIRCALDERQWLARSPSLAEDVVGGILDFDDERDAERVVFGRDGTDGGLPQGVSYVRSMSMYSPRGDDGSYIEEQGPVRGVGRFASYGALGAVL